MHPCLDASDEVLLPGSSLHLPHSKRGAADENQGSERQRKRAPAPAWR
jgi:hypothetical protein